MGAIAPIDFEKCLFAPIDFDKKAYCNHHFLSLMGANLLFITSLHPSIKNPKEGPVTSINSYELICFAEASMQADRLVSVTYNGWVLT